MVDYYFQMKDLSVGYNGNSLIRDINIGINKGEIVTLIGPNGSGKSTILKSITRQLKLIGGTVFFDDTSLMELSYKELSSKMAVVLTERIKTELMNCHDIVATGRYPYTGRLGILTKRDEELVEEAMEAVHAQELGNQDFNAISDGQRQRVLLARAICQEPEILILDEPTSSLNETDAQRLLDLLVKLKAEGMTSIIISHKLNELEQISDKITILRDGRTIETLDRRTDELSEERIIRGMVGREILDVYPARNVTLGPTMFEIRNWSVCNGDAEKKVLDNISLHVRKGEVIGLAGLMGAGRTELALSLYAGSYGTSFSGEILKEDKPVRYKRVSEAIDDGLAYATEDRKAAGLVLGESVCDNIVLSSLKKLSNRGVRNRSLEIREAQAKAKELNVKCPTIYQKTVNLSGGNQQKVVLARWILTAPDVLILDEPTRGIDVGAKREIYSIINELAAQGKAVIFISSEMAELLGMCDRIYVMNEGKIVGELDRPQFSQEAVMSCIMKSSSKEGATK